MTDAERFMALQKCLQQELSDWLGGFTVPICSVERDSDGSDHGRLLGSGTIIALSADFSAVLTCKHVLEEFDGPLAIQLPNTEDFARLKSYFSVPDAGLDVAIAYLEDRYVGVPISAGNGIPVLDIIADRLPTPQLELSAMRGYPGDWSRFAFGTLMTRAVLYLFQFDQIVRDRSYFAVPYAPQMMRDEGNPPPVPRGISGSLVLDTRFFEASSNGVPWNVGCAKVVGLATTMEGDRLWALDYKRLAEALSSVASKHP